MSGNLVLFPSVDVRFVVDSWPVMEWLKRRQPTALRFRGLIERAGRKELVLLMSMVNLGEVYYSAAKAWGPSVAEDVLTQVRELPISFVSVTDDDVFATARLKGVYNISYADGFAAKLAIREASPLITGDGEFRKLADSGLLRVEWVGA